MLGRVFIKEYSINKVIEILEELNFNSIDENMFRNTNHFNDSNNKRFNDLDLVYDLLIKNENVGVLKSYYNTFKIYYKHPSIKTKDVCIVITITENKGVKLITAFYSPEERRVRNYER